ncbi:hypothetical protein E5A73_17880 [Sphingomonas gei]|uniref:Uncharacterized protein n=1 Tax=Sphingomonas gei TaxID=1395960 RepID=A0A4S1X526_9SPHN|nr:hypothetical protein [Sphingomonas gei]TGX50287.1 hypothetical protein E5A73_17880 [Sphingomonas gei]
MGNILSWLAAPVFAAAAASALPPKDNVRLELPILVSEAADAVPEETSTGAMFGAQQARYRSVATIAHDLKLADGTLLLAAGTRLFEHRAAGASFKGPVYCRLVKPKKMAALLCLADQDGNAGFDTLWEGNAVVARSDRLAPALPYPDAKRVALTFDPIGYQIGPPEAEEALQLGFCISGSNPLLGQHHFYEALGTADAPIAITGTHRAVRFSGGPARIEIAGAVIEASKLGKKRYSVRVIKPLEAGEHVLVEQYQIEQRILFIPRG